MTDSLDDFAIGDVLGEGTTGLVYAATHRPTGARVALKTMKARSRAMAVSLDREVAAMVRMYHPHILFLFDHGVAGVDAPFAEGVAWMALEFASGGSLLDHHPVSWRETSALVFAVLDGLAYAHGRGIIHRDLKPDNILVSTGADLRPGIKIADFGLAWATDHDRRGIRRGGTPAYIAPEQVRGSVTELGPWTDLYTFGAMLWEWVTGTPPFGTTASVEELLDAHQHRPLPEFDPLYPVPDGLETVLRALLAKSVTGRPRSAALVTRQLSVLGSVPDHEAGESRSQPDLSWLGTVVLDTPTHESTATQLIGSSADSSVVVVSRRSGRLPVPKDWRGNTPAPSALLAGAGLGLIGRRALTIQGRTEERDVLWTALRDVARSRRPRVVMLVGEEGVGASRLASWMVERVRELDIGEAHTVEREGGLVGTLERAFGVVATSKATVELPATATELERRVFETRAEPRARDVGAWLLERAANGLVVVHVDDPDGQSELERLVTDPLFEASTGDAESCALLVVATGRPDAGLLDELTYLEGAHAVEVPPLPFDAMRDLAHHELGLEERLGIRLARESSGRPATLVWWVRSLAEQGGLRPMGQGFVAVDDRALSAMSATDTDQRFQVFWAELSRTSASGREAILVGAVLGVEVALEEWLGALKLLGISRSETVIRRLVRAGWVQRTATSWRFRTPTVRNHILDGLKAEERRQVHLAIAGALNVLESSPDRTARRGLHLLLAGHDAPALRVLGPALAELGEAHRYGLVESICEQVFRVVDVEALDADARFDLQMPWLIARRENHSGRAVRDELVALAEIAPHLSPERARRVTLMAAEVVALLQEMDLAEALLATLDEPPGALVYRLRALIAHDRGDLDGAREANLASWNATDDPILRGAVANGLGRLEGVSGNLEAAETWFLRASTTVDHRQRGVVHGNLAMLRMMRGNPEEALQSARQAWSLRWDSSLRQRSWFAMVALMCAAAMNEMSLVQQAREPALFFMRRFAFTGGDSLTNQLAERALATAEGPAASAVRAVVDAATRDVTP